MALSTEVQKVNLYNNKIPEILDHYMMAVLNQKVENLSYEEICSTLLVIGDGYEFWKLKYDVDNIVYKLMTILKEDIIEGKLYGSPYLYSGLTQACLSVYSINISSGQYKQFLDKLNKLLIIWTNEYIDNLEQYEVLDPNHFEGIYGLSGVANYLLLFSSNVEVKSLLGRINKNLVTLCEYKLFNNKYIPKWHIENSGLKTERDKQNYPNGYLNFGLSHGIASPLMILSKSVQNNIKVEGQIYSIRNLIKEYKKFSYVLGGITYWPDAISPDQYIDFENKFIKDEFRDGWCYGGLSITLTLLRASNIIGDKDTVNWYIDLVLKKLELGLEVLKLNSPTLCHGYSGIIPILINLQEYINDPIISDYVDELFRKVVDMFDSSTKYGFFNIEHIQRELIKEDKNTFLEGSAGIILTLLSYMGLSKNTYFKMLLM